MAGRHQSGENHQSGGKQEHRGKPDLTEKYEGRHEAPKGGKK